MHSWRQTTIRPGFDDNSRRSPHCGRGRVKTCLKWDLHWKIYTFKYNLWTNSPLLFIFHVVTQRFASFYQWEYFSHGWHWITKFGSQKWRKRFQLLWYIFEGYIFILRIMADVLSEATMKLDKPVHLSICQSQPKQLQCYLQSGIPVLKFSMIQHDTTSLFKEKVSVALIFWKDTYLHFTYHGSRVNWNHYKVAFKYILYNRS